MILEPKNRQIDGTNTKIDEMICRSDLMEVTLLNLV
jgi:hypothetical protein